MKTYLMITTQRDLRAAFWRAHPQLIEHAGWKQNQYPTDTRVAWCEYVDQLARTGEIRLSLAERATL